MAEDAISISAPVSHLFFGGGHGDAVMHPCRTAAPKSLRPVSLTVSYTHLTLPTKRIV